MTTQPTWSGRGPLVLGAVALVLLIGGFGSWSVLARIGSAVVSEGRIEVERNQQIVQHRDGGIIEAVMVIEGETVTAGQPLIQLDGSDLRSDLALAESQLFEARARMARLQAERDGNGVIAFDDELLDAAAASPDVAELVDGQRRLLTSRAISEARELEQLEKQRAQVLEQIVGIDAQISSHHAQLELVAEELQAQKSLLNKGLAQNSTVLTLRREEEELRGSLGELLSSRAQTEQRTTEIELEILKLQEKRREDAITQLRDLSHTARQAAEERRALRERIARLTVTAPVSGVVLGLAYQTPQSVVQPGEVLTYLVPQDRPLVITARISPRDIDQVRQGQPATLRLSALDQSQVPELQGTVVRVSADALDDPASGQSYFLAEMRLVPGEMKKLPTEFVLLPGMPVDCFIGTGESTPLAYLLKPIKNYMARALRES